MLSVDVAQSQAILAILVVPWLGNTQHYALDSIGTVACCAIAERSVGAEYAYVYVYYACIHA